MENFLDNSLENLRIASGFAIINILVSLEFDHQKKDILLEKAYRIIVQTLESPMQDIMQLHVIHIILNLPDDESKCGALNKKKLIEQSYPVIEKMLNSENQRTRAETIDTLKEFPEGKEKTRLLSTVQK